MRSGTVPTPLVVGLGAACDLAQKASVVPCCPLATASAAALPVGCHSVTTFKLTLPPLSSSCCPLFQAHAAPSSQRPRLSWGVRRR